MTEVLPISVVIPCHNGEPFLAQALDSVLAQTMPATEVILVDDGSTDGTATIGRAYAERYPGIVHYVWQKNSGVSESRNVGMRKAKCEWVAFLDADDWFLPEKLARQAALIAAQPHLDFVYTALTNCSGDAPPTVFNTPTSSARFRRISTLDGAIQLPVRSAGHNLSGGGVLNTTGGASPEQFVSAV